MYICIYLFILRVHIKAEIKETKEGLRVEKVTEEPGQGCFSSLTSQRKGRLGDRFRG